MRSGASRLAGSRTRRTVALLPGEPAGTIATRTAGAAELRATLFWRTPVEVPDGPVLPPLPDLGGRALFSLVENAEPRAAARRLYAGIRALTAEDLGLALDVALRAVTETAALAEAVLEIEAARCARPWEAEPRTLEDLARDLGDAGFSVRFADCWIPAPEAEVCVGVGGDGDLEGFLRSLPAWAVV